MSEKHSIPDFLQLFERPRRNRRNQTIRQLVRETSCPVEHLVMPLFIIPGTNQKIEIQSMPGIFRLSADLVLKEIEQLIKLGIQAIALFPSLPEDLKDTTASESVNPNGLYQTTIQSIKENFPQICIITDVAMDPYSSDGHDGFVQDGQILNDETLPILANMALSQAQSGADIIAPSDMMDGRVGYIRHVLDEHGFSHVGILSYCAKYSSSFYGPFRDALDSSPKFGDKQTYQMDPANRREALREARLDIGEGADMLMVKPALAYLDIISDLKNNVDVPIAAYNVSGEFAMLKAAAQNGWIDEKRAIAEILLSMRRAGADIIFTYFAKEYAKNRY